MISNSEVIVLAFDIADFEVGDNIVAFEMGDNIAGVTIFRHGSDSSAGQCLGLLFHNDLHLHSELGI